MSQSHEPTSPGLKVRHVVGTTGELPPHPNHAPVSGVVGATLSLTRRLAQLGHTVEMWGWNDTERSQNGRWDNVTTWTSPRWPRARFARWDLTWLAPVWRHAQTQPATDVLHTHVDPNLLYLPKSRVRLLHLHTPVPERLSPAYLRLLRRADAVICCSDFIRRQFLAASGYAADQTHVIYNGANPKTFQNADRTGQRAQWGLDDATPVVLYAGAIVPEKGVAHLVRAFGQVQAALPQAVLIIVGSAKLWAMPGGNPIGEQYEAEVRQLAQGLNVRFVGNISRRQMPAVYAAADVVSLPSVWSEPLATVLCEAMAAGRPVVGSRTGGTPEAIDDHRTGLLVCPGDEQQLAQGLIQLLSDVELRQRMGQAARERSALFTWEASARQLDQIYRQLLTARAS